MKKHQKQKLVLFGLVLVSGWLFACMAPERQSTPAASSEGMQAQPPLKRSEPEAPAPWTPQFDERSLLLAQEVIIEGPEGLLQHLHCDASTGAFQAETLAEGYRQVIELPPGSSGHIIAQLDGMQIRAEKRLIALEKVTPCDVVVTARGSVYWAVPGSGEEERGEEWTRTGVIER